MEQINLNVRDSDSSDDVSREEMKWNDKNSNLLVQWRDKCSENCIGHGKKAQKYKSLYVWFGLPSVLIPLTIGILQPYLREYEIILSLLMVLSGSFSALTTFFDFSRKRSRHLESENNYNKLDLKIQSILAVPKRNRNACDVTINTCLMTLNSINGQSPPL